MSEVKQVPEKLVFKDEIFNDNPDYTIFKKLFIDLLEDQIAKRYPEVTDADMEEYKKWCNVVKTGEDHEEVRIILETQQNVIIIYAHTEDRVMIYMKSMEDYLELKNAYVLSLALED